MTDINGTHGVLTNKETGATIEGTMGRVAHTSPRSPYFHFQIDGTAAYNSFVRADWDFTEDAPPEPPIRVWYRDKTLWFKRPGQPVMVVHTETPNERVALALSSPGTLDGSTRAVEYTPKEDA